MDIIIFLFNILKACIDILSVAAIFYFVFKILSASKKNLIIITGILVLIVVYFLAIILDLKTLSFLLSQVYSWIVIVFVILFQSEIRESLEKIGSFNFLKQNNIVEYSMTEELIDAIKELAKTKTGALICLEKNISLYEYSRKAIQLNAEFSKYLLMSIFNKETPLHDGAVIIKDDKILCASAYFPISIDINLEKEYGTRHRAALTVSKEFDGIIIIVSEETGKISIAYQYHLYKNVDSVFLKEFIEEKIGG